MDCRTSLRPLGGGSSLVVLLGLLVSLALLTSGCDTFSNLTVNCQVGVKNDKNHIAGCEFRNTGKAAATGCVIVHVLGAKDEADGEREYISDKICSGKVEPGGVTEPLPLTFGQLDPRTVSSACVDESGDKPQFHCSFKIEEVAQ